jgi:hypothetical protein
MCNSARRTPPPAYEIKRQTLRCQPSFARPENVRHAQLEMFVWGAIVKPVSKNVSTPIPVQPGA